MRKDMQGEFAFDRLQPTAPKAVKPLLGTQAAEHRFDDRLALAENAARLRMLHHETKRLTLLILRVAFDTSSRRRFRTVRAQMAIPTGRGPVHPMLSCAQCFNDSFVQPSLAIDASPILHQRLRQLIDALQAKVNALYGFHREPTKNITEFRSGDIASFWLLHTASAAFASLAHLYQHAALHPERLFQELLRLAGQLMTFSKGYALADLPAYRHDDLGPGFARLDTILRDLLETVISTRYFAIALGEGRPSFNVGRIDSGKIDDKTMFYIAVSADMPTVEPVEAVPARFKAGAPDDVDKLVLLAMPGVRLLYTPQVPPAIPVRPGACYFSFESRGALYDRMLQAQSAMFYTSSGINDLKLELIAVTS
jgi:type VI secretion system protein ImpJ